MAVAAQTNKTYDVTTIREDLHSAMTSLTPTDTIFMSTIGSRNVDNTYFCLLYTSPSPRDRSLSRMPSSA